MITLCDCSQCMKVNLGLADDFPLGVLFLGSPDSLVSQVSTYAEL